MRLAKYLAHAGVASRRAAEQLVFAGRVTVGGEVVRDPARDVDGSDARRGRRRAGARCERPARRLRAQQAAPASSRPRSDPHGRPTVVDARARADARLYPVGRLDADTTGLILLTNDGELAHRLTHPRSRCPRIYRAHGPPRRRCASRRCARCARASSSTTA